MARPLRVALLCLDPWQIEESGNHRPFNYAVRRIQAAIAGDARLAHVELALLESESLDVDALSARIEAFAPDVIGASAYVWSFPTLLEAARRAKRSRPDRTILFGGPSARPEMFALPQHADSAGVVDAIVVGEGEACIQEILLLETRDRASLLTVAGLAVHDGTRWVTTPTRDLGPPDQHPSPYQMGLMPTGVTGQIESFRGCPLSCTYCEWGDTGVTPRVFGKDHLVRELRALAEVNAKGTWLVDPALNLSSRAFRNLSAAEAEVGTLKALGSFRCEIYPSHTTDEHLAFLEATQTKYVGIGLQSFDEDVLASVERPFSPARFDRVVGDVAAIVPDTVVEVILGLPGDSPDSFKRTLEKVRTLPVAVRVFHCLVLPSALMTRAPASFALEFDPFTLQMLSCKGWSRRDLERTCAWLDDFAHDESGEIPHGGTWKLPRPGTHAPPKVEPARDRPAELGGGRGASPMDAPSPPSKRPSPAEARAPKEIHDALSRRAAEAAPWTLTTVDFVDGDVARGLVLCFTLDNRSTLVLRATPKSESPAYRELDALGYAYAKRETPLDARALEALDRVLAAIHPVALAAILGVRPRAAKGSLPVL